MLFASPVRLPVWIPELSQGSSSDFGAKDSINLISFALLILKFSLKIYICYSHLDKLFCSYFNKIVSYEISICLSIYKGFS